MEPNTVSGFAVFPYARPSGCTVGRRSRGSRAIAAELARLGYVNGKGEPFAPTQVLQLVLGSRK
jgi:hypothetical protein